jgi:hypothetical protein
MPDDRAETTNELPDISSGMALNMSSSAESLVDDAEAYVAEPTEENRRDLLASMRIMRHRIDRAMTELGLMKEIAVSGQKGDKADIG